MSTPSAKRPWWAPLENPKEIRKLLVFMVTVAGLVSAENLIHGTPAVIVQIGLGLAGSYGIFAIPNAVGVPGTYVPGSPPAPVPQGQFVAAHSEPPPRATAAPPPPPPKV
jgi:hypothetical protein